MTPGQKVHPTETVTLFIDQILFGRLYAEHFAFLMLNPFNTLLGNSVCSHCMDQNTEASEKKGPQPRAGSPESGRSRLSATRALVCDHMRPCTLSCTQAYQMCGVATLYRHLISYRGYTGNGKLWNPLTGRESDSVQCPLFI